MLAHIIGKLEPHLDDIARATFTKAFALVAIDWTKPATPPRKTKVQQPASQPNCKKVSDRALVVFRQPDWEAWSGNANEPTLYDGYHLATYLCLAQLQMRYAKDAANRTPPAGGEKLRADQIKTLVAAVAKAHRRSAPCVRLATNVVLKQLLDESRYPHPFKGTSAAIQAQIHLESLIQEIIKGGVVYLDGLNPNNRGHDIDAPAGVPRRFIIPGMFDLKHPIIRMLGPVGLDFAFDLRSGGCSCWKNVESGKVNRQASKQKCKSRHRLAAFDPRKSLVSFLRRLIWGTESGCPKSDAIPTSALWKRVRLPEREGMKPVQLGLHAYFQVGEVVEEVGHA